MLTTSVDSFISYGSQSLFTYESADGYSFGFIPAQKPTGTETKNRDVMKERERAEGKRRQQKRWEEQKLQDRRDRDKKATSIQGRIARLRSQISCDQTDNKAKAELSMAKTQLYWVQNAL